jgi:hypothetical protein
MNVLITILESDSNCSERFMPVMNHTTVGDKEIDEGSRVLTICSI